MTEPPGRTGSSPGRRRFTRRRVTVLAAAYLICWVVTCAFAPPAVNRWWARHRPAVGYGPGGRESPVEFRTGVEFVGEDLRYEPSPIPDGEWWCCAGRPWCPAPFVVASEVAWVDAPLSGFAGTAWFVWTPFGVVEVHMHRVWVV